MLGTKSLCKLTGCIYRMLNWKLFVFIQFVSIYNEIAFINSADLNSFGETASAQRFTSQTYLRSMNVWVCLCLGCAYDHVWYVIICIRAVIAASLHYLKQICSAHAAHSHTHTSTYKLTHWRSISDLISVCAVHILLICDPQQHWMTTAE